MRRAAGVHFYNTLKISHGSKSKLQSEPFLFLKLVILQPGPPPGRFSDIPSLSGRLCFAGDGGTFACTAPAVGLKRLNKK